MVRNKNQSQDGLKDNRLQNQDDNRQNTKTPNRELTQDDEQRGGARKNLKGANTRQGSPGKNNR